MCRWLTDLNFPPSIATVACMQAHRASRNDEMGPNLAYGAPVILAQIGDRLGIGGQTSRRPAGGLAIDPAEPEYPEI